MNHWRMEWTLVDHPGRYQLLPLDHCDASREQVRKSSLVLDGLPLADFPIRVTMLLQPFCHEQKG